MVRTLIVQHVPESRPPAFTVVRPDPAQTTPDVASITAPEQFGAEELSGSHLRRELRWYLEHFLDYPFPPNTERADRVLKVLQDWGQRAFSALFLAGKAHGWYHDAVRDGAEHLQLRIIANDPAVLAWPWEALHDPERGYLAHKCHIERQLNNVPDPPPLHADLPRDRLNILLVTARPFEADVEYRSISRALVEQIEQHRLAATVTVLRPPTFDALREELGRRAGYYHILHFDGHGGYGVIAEDPDVAGTLAEAVNPHAFQAPQGCLVFETADGQPHPVPAETLSATLSEFRIPMVVLNACQSATIDESAENAFASVAASLIRAGIRSVVAMAYSLYVSGAQHFLPAFYRRLLETGSLAEPTRAGRAAMLAHPGRVCARGTHPLKDWLVPVVYQQQPADLSFVTRARDKGADRQAPSLPEEATDKENPYGFIGRDGAILALERALLRDAPAVLIHGLGGVGKTTLARGFVQWLGATEGLGAGCLWFTFNDIHTAQYVLHGIGTALFGPQFIPLETEQKLDMLGQALCENRLIVVWDNFESASGNEAAGIDPLLGADDLQLLRRFLQGLQGGKTKVLVTSRSEEAWLPAHLRYKLPLGGLTGEARWEFCTAILRNLGIKTDRKDPGLVDLMDTLDGHPLLMRAVLPRLEGGRSAKSILEEVQGNLAQPGAGADPTQEKVYATLRFVEDGLPKGLRPLLVPLGLHERFVDADIMELMAKQAGQTRVTRSRIDGLFAALAGAGLLRERRSNTIFELHPALTGFLRTTLVGQTSRQLLESWQRAFVEIFSNLANKAAPKLLYEQQGPFFIHGANFHAALVIAQSLSMHKSCAALSQSLAAYALNTRDFDSAERLFTKLVEYSRLVEDRGIEASAYHQLGMIAEERRDFETAEKWYSKALKIDRDQGDEHGAAGTYHQLGMVAWARRDLETAEKWHLKALEIEQKYADEHRAAFAYHQLGMIAQERRDFETAEKWYLKSLEIEEKQGNEHGAAGTYHQLGMMAEERRDFETAEKWYLKSLEIKEKQGNEHGAASTYHQLGRIAQERGDFETAEKWYLKSLEISERLGIDSYAATTYHHLGMVAEERRDFDTTEKWYLKALRIFEEEGNEQNAAITYHQLGTVAKARGAFDVAEKWYLKSLEIEEKLGDEYWLAGTYHQLGNLACARQDFDSAETWYAKSLEISEKHANEHGAAMTYAQLGNVAGLRGRFVESAKWLTASIRSFRMCRDLASGARATRIFLDYLNSAREEERAQMLRTWDQAGLGGLPDLESRSSATDDS